MAALTSVQPADVAHLCEVFGLGPLLTLEPVAGGSVNSNYALTIGGNGRTRRVFLRLYEEQTLETARLEAGMLARLRAAGVATPAPLVPIDGSEPVHVLAGKPAALFPWCEGVQRCQAGVTPADTHEVGRALARVHLAGRAEPSRPGRFEVPHLIERCRVIAGAMDPDLACRGQELTDRLLSMAAKRPRDLPRGLIHGDLFRDNVLWSFEGSGSAGIAALLDFESACDGSFAYDIMVAVLAWCYGSDLDLELARALLAGYGAVRPLEPEEWRALFVEGSMAALRFTVTRITDYAMRAHDGPRVVKDWRRFAARRESLERFGEIGLVHALHPTPPS